MDFSKEIIDKFMSYVDVKGEDECWVYQHYCDKKGYGVFYVDKDHVCRAHRFSYLLANGKFPDNLCCHSCDNPPCCNPLHLWDGTNKQNMEDMVAKGRGENRHKLDNAGIKNIACKLTEEQVLSIRHEYKRENHWKSNCKKLAIKYKVSCQTITRIISHATWSHI
jgi:hypothetical protein